MEQFGVEFTEATNAISPVNPAPTSVIALETITTWGPTDDPFESTAFPEWQKVWGPPTTNGFGYLWAKAAYDIAGPGLRIVTKRVIHLTNVANRASKTSAAATGNYNTANLSATHGSVTSANAHPHNLEPADTLVIVVNGGSPATATFNAAAAFIESAATAPFTLANGQTLTVKVDRGAVQTITFLTAEFVDITNATLAEVAAVINAKIVGAKATIVASKVRITSDLRGLGSHVEVTVASTATDLGYSNTEQNGTGNVDNIDSVTLTEQKTIIEAAVPGLTVSDSGGFTKIESNTSGGSSSILVQASSSADTAMGFDNATHSGSASGTVARIQLDAKYDGARGNSLAPVFSPATNGDSLSFNMTILENGVQGERVMANLSVDPDSLDYFVTRINHLLTGSTLVVATDLAVDNVNPPDPSGLAGSALTGGNDGLSGLTDADFNGDQGARTGLFGFQPVESVPGNSDIAILAVPDRPTSSLHNNAITYCEVYRSGDIQFIVDLPAGLTVDQAITYVTSTAGLLGFSEHSYTVYDRIKVDNSRPDVFGTAANITIPNSCVVAGAWARTDASRPGGVSDPPAGTNRGKVSGVVRGLEVGEAIDPARFAKLRDNRINAIIRDTQHPFYIRGTRTLRADGQFPGIQERRLASFLKKSLENTYQEVMDDVVEDALKTAETLTDAFLRKWTDRPIKAFRSTKPSEAFSVDFGAALNPASSRVSGEGFGAIAIATKKSLEKLGIVLGQNLADVQAALASQSAA